jgi:hypothetical protein
MFLKMIMTSAVVFSTAALADSVSLHSESGDTLMIHQFKNGELWGSFMPTDQVAESFAEHELILLQVDEQQPIQLEGKRSCGGAAGEKQQFSYDFTKEKNADEISWQFSRSSAAKQDVFALLGDNQKSYQILSVDRRPEVVDFPIRASVGLPILFRQIKRGETISFRYTTEADEQRLAVFNLKLKSAVLSELLIDN